MHGNGGRRQEYIDLHVHSRYSDGSLSIREVLEIARSKDLAAIAITDHDCIDGYPQAIELGVEYGVTVIPGAELSSEIDGIDVHILGYFLDITNAALGRKLQEMKDARYVRAESIVRNLNRQHVDLQFETVLKYAGEGAIGRPHIAAAMLSEELVYSFKEAFDRYIGYDSPAYVEKLRMSPREIFSLILDAGGIPVLAHPGVTGVDERIPGFVRDGLAGMEVYHTEHSAARKRHYREFCRRNDLVATGGSDFHGEAQGWAEIGSPRISSQVLDELRRKCELVHG